jgi:hypothetical protein
MSSSASVFYLPYRTEWKGPDQYWPVLDLSQYPPDRLFKIFLKKTIYTQFIKHYEFSHFLRTPGINLLE